MRRAFVLLLVLTMSGCSAAETVDETLPVVYNGGQLEMGETYRYPFFIHCGMRWLPDLNDEVWMTDNPVYRGTGRYPESLRQWFRNPDEQISPELWTYVTLTADDEITLTLPDGSSESIYRSTDEEMPGCA